MVVIRGALIMAGLWPRRAVSRGRAPPRMFAHKETTGREMPTAIPTAGLIPLHTNDMAKTHSPSRDPIMAPVTPSFAMTITRSEIPTCPNASALMTVATDWEPVLPPWPMSNGTK
eukprot:CAMPEP_0117656106 /NCGR_PEP_ID=MMETSP0804-20121206/4629_1 /TAXON_ID=1074897 /ORGANISM="Tetraselmis astigmatica, Strain CCMP880" /LENGTH=114 /DNA_ID=CAMNT_0005462489 /DNA_START=410 /DNA_END=754 /DNA_ORIENTATION=-